MFDAVLKKQLRKNCLEKRNQIEDRCTLSKEIADKLTGLCEYKNAKNILAYASFGSEVETKELMSRILADGKSLFLPKCEVKTKELQAIKTNDLHTLKKGAYGIAEPSGEVADPCAIDLVIVPLVGFDRTLARLGYGGGYYDRFLPKTGAKCIAIAFSRQEIREIPREETDILMDMIVTEKEVIKGAF